jgi:DNA-binding winged helix-turn-helix (wHTH) protein/TolB-like protein/Flp pilus assembly protein TadD
MNGSDEAVFEFHGFRLDRAKRLLNDPDGNPIKLLPKAFDILVFLVDNRERVVTKDDLFSVIWPDAIVEENNLTQNISSLRKAFGEKPYENRFISTVPGRGYRFVAPVSTENVGSVERHREEFSEQTRAVDDTGPAKRRSSWLSMGLISGIALIALAAITYFYYRVPLVSPDLKTLAILPLKPITLENRDEALEMGITDSLISKLGGAGELRVLPLAAVRRFASVDQDPISAGRQLNVDAVLDGGVQISNGRVRISAQLFRVSDGHQLWSGQFDEDLKGIFAVQDSLSQRVAAALARPLGNRPQKTYTTNAAAYQLFMRGKYHAYKLVLPEVQKGIDYYEQAIAADPNYALAYVELANAYRAMVLTSGASPMEMFPKSKAAAAKAVELDNTLAEAWTALAFNEFWFDWDWKASEEHFKRALDLDPTSAQTHAFYAHLLSNVDRHNEALSEIRKARELEPILLLYAAFEGQILCFAGQTDSSTMVLKSVIEMDPSFWLGHLFLTRNYIQKRMWPEALESAEKAKQISNGNVEAVGTIGFILGMSGDIAGARSALADLQLRSKDGYVSAYSMAEAYLGIGDKPAALDQLEKAVEQKDPLIVFLSVEPRWEGLRNEPRFIELLRLLKLENK